MKGYLAVLAGVLIGTPGIAGAIDWPAGVPAWKLGASPEWGSDPTGISIVYSITDGAGATITAETRVPITSATQTVDIPVASDLGKGYDRCLFYKAERSGTPVVESELVGPVCRTFALQIPPCLRPEDALIQIVVLRRALAHLPVTDPNVTICPVSP